MSELEDNYMAAIDEVRDERDRLRAQLEEIAALADRSDFKRVGQMAKALDDIRERALSAIEQEPS